MEQPLLLLQDVVKGKQLHTNMLVSLKPEPVTLTSLVPFRCAQKAWQGHNALAVGAGGGCLAVFLSSIISLFFLPLKGRHFNIE